MGIMATLAVVMSVMTGVQASDGLYTLATTGSGDAFAVEYDGESFHKTGGNPHMFTYEVDTPWQADAMSVLKAGEFLAPHFAVVNGSVFVMVAPHLFIDGEVMKGKGPDDNFIVITEDGKATRYDYSDDIAGM